MCSPVFSGQVESWPKNSSFSPGKVYLSRGDSAEMRLPDQSVDLVVTDPPFFDNVHYSELADFFYSWQQIIQGKKGQTTRNQAEVQDVEAEKFAGKLQAVFQECYRVLKDDGLLVFTYHHSRDEGWNALADAILRAGFVVVNSHPVKAEMSVAAPKSQAKEPIQLDIILVCRKASAALKPRTIPEALDSARAKLKRLQSAGFYLSRNDRKIVLYGQLLTTLTSVLEAADISQYVEGELVNGEHSEIEPLKYKVRQLEIF